MAVAIASDDSSEKLDRTLQGVTGLTELFVLKEQEAQRKEEAAVRERQQRDEDDERRWKRVQKYVLAPVVAAIVGGGGFTGWSALNSGGLEEQVKRQDVVNERIHRKLGVELIEVRKQLVEGIRYGEAQTNAILTAIETGKIERPEKPAGMRVVEQEVELREVEAKAGELLHVSDAEIQEALSAGQ